MKGRSIFLLAALIILPAAAYCINGGTEGGGRSMNRGGKDEQPSMREKVNTDNLREILTYKNELELSVEQIESIRNIRGQSIKDTQSGYEALYKKQLELSDLLATPKPDFTGAHAMALEITKAVVNVQSVSIDSYEKAYNLLTESQKLKLAIIREKLKKERDSENQLSK
jgi:Spy/CpxP family protein refolding chaperone